MNGGSASGAAHHDHVGLSKARSAALAHTAAANPPNLAQIEREMGPLDFGSNCGQSRSLEIRGSRMSMCAPPDELLHSRPCLGDGAQPESDRRNCVGGARSWDERIDRICNARPQRGWTPGERAGYDPYAGWFILGELLQRATGEYLPDLLRQSVFEPMGMPDCHVGLACHVYEDLVSGGRLASLPDTSDGSAEDTVHTREWLTHCSPGSSGVGPMRQLARFYEAMLRRGQADGRHVLSPDSVAQMIGRQRAGLRDRTFAYAMDWGLGVVLDKPGRRGRMPYGYGRHASPDTFGHGGVQSSVGFADPAHGLAVGVAFVGMPGERIHQHRIDTLLTTLYEELGLV